MVAGLAKSEKSKLFEMKRTVRAMIIDEERLYRQAAVVEDRMAGMWRSEAEKEKLLELMSGLARDVDDE